MKRIAILGSTGSIGKSTLDVISQYEDEFKIIGLSANSDYKTLAEQVKKYKPKVAAIADSSYFNQFKAEVGTTDTKLIASAESLIEVSTHSDVDAVVSAIVGGAGLLPTLEAIKSEKEIHLANKEVLVMAGQLVNHLLEHHKVVMLPVDSEHNAIFQCLHGGNNSEIEKIILTASGGPFRFSSQEELENVTTEMALNHPNWDMGPKITIDSSTMMNKGLELIEAKWLFDIDESKIEFLIHPESIIHSMVQFQDGSVLAQLGVSDMRIPIQYALTYPTRLKNKIPRVDFSKQAELRFITPDYKKFPALRLSREVLKKGDTYPVVLNGANEIAVDLFLKEKIRYLDIIRIIEYVLERHQYIQDATLEQILEVDIWSREEAKKWISVGSSIIS